MCILAEGSALCMVLHLLPVYSMTYTVQHIESQQLAAAAAAAMNDFEEAEKEWAAAKAAYSKAHKVSVAAKEAQLAAEMEFEEAHQASHAAKRHYKKMKVKARQLATVAAQANQEAAEAAANDVGPSNLDPKLAAASSSSSGGPANLAVANSGDPSNLAVASWAKSL